MSKNSGSYFLVRDKNGIIDYFDFHKMRFSKYSSDGVSLSTIDSLTTWFPDGQYLCNFLDRTDVIKSNYDYKFYIKQIIPNSKSPKPNMYVVWEDSTLNAISKITDGKVDLFHENVYEIFLNMINEIKDQQSGLARILLTSNRPEFRLSKLNKDTVEVLASSSSTKKMPLFSELVKCFLPYNEFRALYLAYKENDRSKTYTIGDRLSKMKDRF